MPRLRNRASVCELVYCSGVLVYAVRYGDHWWCLRCGKQVFGVVDTR